MSNTQQVTDILAMSPTAFWEFNDASNATQAADASGNNHPLTNATSTGTSNTFGVTATQTNDSDTAVQTGSTNSGFQAAANAAFTIGTNDFTFGIWVNCSSPSGNPFVLFGQTGFGGDTTVYWFGIDTNGKACYAMGSNSPTDGTNVSDGNWHFLVFRGKTTAGNRTISIWVDNQHSSSADTTYNTAMGNSTNALGVLNFNQSPVGAEFGYVGKVKKAFFINGTAISDAQVGQIYNDVTSAGTSILIGNPNWYFSPYGWYTSGTTFAETANPGNYFKIKFGGTSCKVNVDVSPLNGQSSSNFPKICYSLDGGSLQTVQLPASSGAAISLSSLGTGPHTLTVYFKSSVQTIDRWNTPVNVFRVTSLTLDNGDALQAPTVSNIHYLFYGDSITEGVNITGANNDLQYNDGTATYAALYAKSQNVEYGIVGFGYQGYVHGGNGNVPAFGTALPYYFSGTQRSFSPTPNMVFVNEGTNDVSANGITLTQSNVTTALTTLRGDVGSSVPIKVIVPFGLYNESTIQAAVASLNDAHTAVIDLGSTGANFVTSNSFDGLHPNANGHVQLEALLANAVSAQSGPVSSPSSTPTSNGANLSANVTGGTAPFTYSWSGAGLTIFNSQTATPTVTAASNGNYTATVVVTDANGLSVSASIQLSITITTTTVTPSTTSTTYHAVKTTFMVNLYPNTGWPQLQIPYTQNLAIMGVQGVGTFSNGQTFSVTDAQALSIAEAYTNGNIGDYTSTPLMIVSKTFDSL